MTNLYSRGECISAYNGSFSKGAKVYSGQLKYAAITGTCANSGVVYSLAHGLASVPKIVTFEPFGNAAALKGAATSAGMVGSAAAVSAFTATNIYFAGAKNVKFTAYCFL